MWAYLYPRAHRGRVKQIYHPPSLPHNYGQALLLLCGGEVQSDQTQYCSRNAWWANRDSKFVYYWWSGREGLRTGGWRTGGGLIDRWKRLESSERFASDCCSTAVRNVLGSNPVATVIFGYRCILTQAICCAADSVRCDFSEYHTIAFALVVVGVKLILPARYSVFEFVA